MNIASRITTTFQRVVLVVIIFTLAGVAQAKPFVPRNPMTLRSHAASLMPRDSVSGSPWAVQQIAAAPDGTSRLLWTASSSDSSQTVAAVWKLDAKGNKVSSGPVYGPYTDSTGGWYPEDLLVAPNGTMRLLWIYFGYSDDTSIVKGAVWTLDANGNKTGAGPVYGPFYDRDTDAWIPFQFVFMPDGTLRLGWINFTDASDSDNPSVVTIWKLDTNGKQLGSGPIYGPYSTNAGDWIPSELRVASDGTLRLFWYLDGNDNSQVNGDTIGIWKLDTNGTKTETGPTYGPYDGWFWYGFDLDTADNSMRLLWYNTDTSIGGDAATVWSFDTNGTKKTAGPVYGPYAGWSANDLVVLRDGTSRVEWLKDPNDDYVTGPTVAFWGFDSNDKKSFAGPIYGPYDGWTLEDYTFNRSDNSFHLLWNRDDNAWATWSLNSSGSKTSAGSIYGPYTY